MFAVLMNGDTPLPIVIFDQQGTICAGPGAPLSSHSRKGDPLKPKTGLNGPPSSPSDLLYAAFVAVCTACAAARMTSITTSGCDSMGTWLLATSVTLAPIRFAKNRSKSGGTVRSFLPTMYQLGFDFQAVPPAFALNKSAWGTP